MNSPAVSTPPCRPRLPLPDAGNRDVLPGSSHAEPIAEDTLIHGCATFSQAFMRVVVRTFAVAQRVVKGGTWELLRNDCGGLAWQRRSQVAECAALFRPTP